MQPQTENSSSARVDDAGTEPSAGPVYEAVVRLAERHATGVLRLGRREEIWLADGLVTLAVGPSSPDLAQVLVGAGLGTELELRDLINGRRLDDAEPPPTGLDAVLDARPHSHDRVLRLLHEYKLSSLFELLVRPEIDAEFVDGATHPLGDRFGEHALDLLDKAWARIDLWRRIAARIPSTAACFRISPELPADCEDRALTADEWRYLALLDGSHSVADVIHHTGDSAFRVCSALYRLLLEGLIVSADGTVGGLDR